MSQDRREPMMEKLVGGGVKHFHAAEVVDLSPSAAGLFVTLQNGERFELIEETLNVPIHGTTVVTRRTTSERIYAAKNPAKPVEVETPAQQLQSEVRELRKQVIQQGNDLKASKDRIAALESKK